MPKLYINNKILEIINYYIVQGDKNYVSCIYAFVVFSFTDTANSFAGLKAAM